MKNKLGVDAILLMWWFVLLFLGAQIVMLIGIFSTLKAM